MEKESEAYKTIGEVAKMVGLINKKKGTLSTHTIRFWEKEFRQIKPKILSFSSLEVNDDLGQSPFLVLLSNKIIFFIKYKEDPITYSATESAFIPVAV